MALYSFNRRKGAIFYQGQRVFQSYFILALILHITAYYGY